MDFQGLNRFSCQKFTGFYNITIVPISETLVLFEKIEFYVQAPRNTMLSQSTHNRRNEISLDD